MNRIQNHKEGGIASVYNTARIRRREQARHGSGRGAGSWRWSRGATTARSCRCARPSGRRSWPKRPRPATAWAATAGPAWSMLGQCPIQSPTTLTSGPSPSPAHRRHIAKLPELLKRHALTVIIQRFQLQLAVDQGLDRPMCVRRSLCQGEQEKGVG